MNMSQINKYLMHFQLTNDGRKIKLDKVRDMDMGAELGCHYYKKIDRVQIQI